MAYPTRSCLSFWARTKIVSVAALTLAGASASAAPPAATNFTTIPQSFRVRGACSDQERWQQGPHVPKAWFDIFVRLIAKKSSPISDYNKAYTMKERLKSKEGQALGDYWMARSLYQAGLIHLAQKSFNEMVSQPDAPEILGIRLGALECLNRIHREYGSFSLNQAAAERLTLISWQSVNRYEAGVLREAAFYYLKNQPADSSWTDGLLGRMYRLLRGGGAFEALAQGFLAVRMGDYPAAATSLTKYFSYPTGPVGFYDGIRKFDDTAHLLLARIHYEYKDYDKAIEEFKKMNVTSNYFPQSLSDISWAHLRKRSYNDAVGSAFSLQTGGMAKTFTPEAPVIAAISLVELCHYPEALRQLKYLQKSYYKSYKWLHEWSTASAQPKTLYQQASEYLKRSKDSTAKPIPSKVATEWFRSPVFLSAQKEVNLIYDERIQIRSIASRISKIQKPGYIKLKGMLSALWEDGKAKEKGLVDRMNNDLANTNRRMMAEISSAAENAQLVEAEIYNAAGEDMIRTNANPDLVVAAKKLKADPKSEKLPTWDWGRLPAAEADENVEVWEDELGFLKGDLTDQCPKKGQ